MIMLMMMIMKMMDRNTKLVEHDAGGRSVKVRGIPISIPFDRFVTMVTIMMMTIVIMMIMIPLDRFVTMAEGAEKPKLNLQPGTKIILSVDTVDYTKGLVNRLTAFQLLLEKYHVHQGKVVLVQVKL